MPRAPAVSGRLRFTPTISWPRPWIVRPVGISSIASRLSTDICDAFCTSTTGDDADTVTDSSTVPTRISTLMTDVKSAGNSTCSRLSVWNPGKVNVTTYTPGRRSMILYWPDPSVVTERDFSISTSLDASAVTPGSTEPDVSLTMPAIAL